MARLTRLVIPGETHHLLVRGNDNTTIVRDDTDRARYLDTLRTAATQHGIAIHAYVLMDDSVHVLATPASAEGLGRMMQAVGRNYVAWFNQRYQRAGTLWEGRFRCGLIEAEPWLLPGMRYIEMLPARAGQVVRAEDFAWSSARHHLGLRADPLLSDHARFWALGNTPFEREAAYRDFLQQSIPPDQSRTILEACLRGWALGSPAFLSRIEHAGARPARPRQRGRPRKT